MIKVKELEGLHGLGFAIHLLHPKSKRPIGNEWTKGPRKTFDDLKQAFKTMPNANVGVRVGTPSKFKDGSQLVIVDVDAKTEAPEHLNELNQALRNMNLPQGAFVKSGRGGESKHIYLRSKTDFGSFLFAQSKHIAKVKMPSVKTFTQKEMETLTEDERGFGLHLRPAWEIEIYSSGKQVVIPPSIHPDTGNKYEWGRTVNSLHDVPLYDFSSLKKPDKVIEPVLKVPDAAFKRESIELLDLVLDGVLGPEIQELIESGDCAKYEGDRSRAVFAAICSLVNAKLTDNQIASVMTERSYGLSEKAWEKGGEREAVKWILTQVRKAREYTSPSKQFDVIEENKILNEDEAVAQSEDLLKPELKKNQNGTIKNCSYNIDLIFRSFDNADFVTFSDFSFRVTFTKNPPWAEVGQNFSGKEFKDNDAQLIQIWIMGIWGFEATIGAINGVIRKVARANSHHPVRDYLKSLKWDGKPRLDYLLEDYFSGKSDKLYMEHVGSKTLIGAVKRVFEPGCKFDTVLIIEGDQGTYKSTALSVLGGKWFSDNLGDITNKDVINNLQNVWIMEVGELTSFGRTESNALKEFITRATDRARLAFQVNAESYERQCIFIGTTNASEYLKDETGNRRFLPVRTGKIDIQKLKEDRDQLWAEAYKRYLDGETVYLDDEDVKMIALEEQSQRYVHDEWSNDITQWLKGEGAKIAELTVRDIWTGALNHSDATKLDVWAQKRIGACLRTAGFVQHRGRREGQMIRFWVKK